MKIIVLHAHVRAQSAIKTKWRKQNNPLKSFGKGNQFVKTVLEAGAAGATLPPIDAPADHVADHVRILTYCRSSGSMHAWYSTCMHAWYSTWCPC